MPRQCDTVTVYGPGAKPGNGDGNGNGEGGIVDTIKNNPALAVGGLGVGALAVVALTDDEEDK